MSEPADPSTTLATDDGERCDSMEIAHDRSAMAPSSGRTAKWKRTSPLCHPGRSEDVQVSGPL